MLLAQQYSFWSLPPWLTVGQFLAVSSHSYSSEHAYRIYRYFFLNKDTSPVGLRPQLYNLVVLTPNIVTLGLKASNWGWGECDTTHNLVYKTLLWNKSLNRWGKRQETWPLLEHSESWSWLREMNKIKLSITSGRAGIPAGTRTTMWRKGRNTWESHILRPTALSQSGLTSGLNRTTHNTFQTSTTKLIDFQ